MAPKEDGRDLSRGFGKDIALTLVEFKSTEMARNALPTKTMSRAIPILSEEQGVKSIGDIVKELAQQMGRCMHCDHARLNCNKYSLEEGCKIVNKRKKGVQATVKAVDREMTINAAPAAKVRVGKLTVRKVSELLDEDVAQKIYDQSQEQGKEEEAKEEGEITEEPTAEACAETDSLFSSESRSSVLDACQ